MGIKVKLSLAFLTALLLTGCSLLEEKRSSVDTSTNTEAMCRFETDTTAGAAKRPVGCYPDYTDDYDYSDVTISYQFRITSEDYVQVCISSKNVGPAGNEASLTLKTIKFYVSNTKLESYGQIWDPDGTVGINGVNGETAFLILGTSTCSWVSGGTLVAELDMTDLKDYKYIHIVDACIWTVSYTVSPYEQSRLIGG